jgi:hypothetical protein
MHMKKIVITLILLITGLAGQIQKTEAQTPVIEVIKNAVKKAIKAMDLQVQRQQNKIIWLQTAQKTLENIMTKLKLDNISEWVEKQRNLYQNYYEELAKVKSIISYYKRIRDISQMQIQLVKEYHRAWTSFKQDKNFTSEELNYMAKVYSGILDESIKNIDQVSLVISSFQTKMADAKRLEIINAAADHIEANFYDLTRFNQQNILLSLQRGKDYNDVNTVKKLYGLTSD